MRSARELTGSLTLRAFLDLAAAAVPVPGGGGIAALAGAAAASMLEMTLNFTAGRKKFASVDAEARRLLAEVSRSRGRLLELVAEDADAYGAVAAAMKMPAGDPAEARRREAALQSAMQSAARPPLEMVSVISSLAAAAPRILEIGNPNLAGDTAVAAALLPGASRAAALNVWANIAALGPRQDQTSREVLDALARIESDCSRVTRKVEDALCPRKTKDPTSQ
jgi:formiminotetrahydrofolate cyclodeaminase